MDQKALKSKLGRWLQIIELQNFFTQMPSEIFEKTPFNRKLLEIASKFVEDQNGWWEHPGWEGFLDLLQSDDTRFALSWVENLSQEVIRLHERIEELSLKSPRARIASYVLLLAEVQHGVLVSLPVYRKSIATFLGIAHETF